MERQAVAELVAEDVRQERRRRERARGRICGGSGAVTIVGSAVSAAPASRASSSTWASGSSPSRAPQLGHHEDAGLRRRRLVKEWEGALWVPIITTSPPA